MELEAQLKLYLKAYSEKDLDSISHMFAEDIHLRDWKISVFGKEDAIKETRKNFSVPKSINIQLLDYYIANKSIVAELRIVVGKEELFVVDILEFNSNNKIKSIRAFLGRGSE